MFVKRSRHWPQPLQLLILTSSSLLMACVAPAKSPLIPATNPALIGPVVPITNQQWFATSKYGVIIHYLPRAGTDPILAAPDGTWNTTIKNVDVNRFASDIQKTGAAYVMFSLGQNSGFYVAPSAVYSSKTGTQPGQYVTERDLIADLSAALNKLGIKLFVYASVLGPTEAPKSILERFPVPSDQAEATTRETLNAMFEELSKRWGSSVAGWWLDGCYPGVAGYGNPSDGEANIDALLRAVKAGNSDALASCNPSVERFEALSQGQDYMAGEENVFHRYPSPNQVLQFKGKNQTWHVASFLGSNWGALSAAQYRPEQLASYIQNVSDRAGVVTVDLAIRADGSIFPAHLETMAQVKSYVRDHQAMPSNANLALYKTARLISNTTGLELPFNGNVYSRFAAYAVDGRKAVNDPIAQGSLEYAWSLELDLDVLTQYSRAVVTFPAETFATNFDLMASDDRQNWKTIKHMEVTTGGIYTLEFAATRSRYVRLRANTPDGPNQPGTQMGIAEFELFAN
jgi:Alpha-L-fucosidase